MTVLSPEAYRVLEEVKDVYEKNGGWPVRVRDLTSRTPSTIHSHLIILERLGYVEKGPGRMGWRPKTW